MKKLLLFLLPLIFLSFQCGTKDCCVNPPQPQGVMNLNFKPLLDGKPFVINQVYNLAGKNVRFTKLAFYLTQACPSTASGMLDCTANTYFIDLTTLDDSTKSTKGFTQVMTKIAEGNQTGLQVGYGVKKSLNVSTPKDFASSNPLSNADYYWADWKSYIFVKLEGSMDKDGDGRFETGITLHTGGDDSFRPTWFPKVFTVDTKGSTTLNFDVNINTILRGIDLTTVNSTHQTCDKPTMLKMMDNLKDAVILK